MSNEKAVSYKVGGYCKEANHCPVGWLRAERKLLYSILALLFCFQVYTLGFNMVGQRVTLADAKVMYSLLGSEYCTDISAVDIRSLYMEYGEMDSIKGYPITTPLYEWLINNTGNDNG